MARSMRRNFYMLDAAINETNEHEAFMTRLMRRNFYMLHAAQWNKWTGSFYHLLQMAKSMRRNFYMLDTAINDTKDIKLLSFAEDGQIHA